MNKEKCMLKKHLLAAACLTALMGAGAANAYTTITIAPPPPRHEVVPAHRPGHVWAPGHYEMRHNHYVWVSGHWLREREGYAYSAHRWEQRDGHWVMRGGNWERSHGHAYGDKDRDGIANRYDHDKDGDGVRNRDDRAPGNPNRS
jgi:hypothetical protein